MQEKTPLKKRDPEALKRDIMDNLFTIQARIPETATPYDWYMAVAYTVRDRVMYKWMETIDTYLAKDEKAVSFLSPEFLIGPQLESNLINLDISDQMKQAVEELGLNFEELLGEEVEAGLGSGGLGRLGACFLDSQAALEYLGVGYGIHYEFGIFEQSIQNGWQVEETDKWFRTGNPWEVIRPEISFHVNFGGFTEARLSKDGEGKSRIWKPYRAVKGVARDYTIPGFRVNTINLLRLWRAEAVKSFDFQVFNKGDYYGAVEEKVLSENITKVLYPNDEAVQGKRLRLEQQYFFVSCSLQDMIRVHFMKGHQIETFHHTFAVHLNDTHPSIAIVELMRLLLDEHDLSWQEAWKITCATFTYTNHTLQCGELERWPIGMFSIVLPRHLEILFEINKEFLEGVRKTFPGDEEMIKRVSIIEETGERHIRMAHLACIGSHSINGVSEAHTETMIKEMFPDFYKLYPEKFVNITNGVSPRRWLLQSNPKLSHLISSKIGDLWTRDLEELTKLEEHINDSQFKEEWRDIKRENKVRLATLIEQKTAIIVNPDSLFDIQINRIHEYKRPHLNILDVIALYNTIKTSKTFDTPSRTVIFGGKAAPGSTVAKLIIKLITSVADIVNKDPDMKDRLKVVFLPNFNVSMGQIIYPAADLSEQISTSGLEASGTANMKFAMNGAVTIGTFDGANIELLKAVGNDNFFLFGLTAAQVNDLKENAYKPQDYFHQSPELKGAIDALLNGDFSEGDTDLFKPLVEPLLKSDPYMLLADHPSYRDAKSRIDKAYQDKDAWTQMSILNTARSGKFSSDRAIREYATKVWNIQPVPIHNTHT